MLFLAAAVAACSLSERGEGWTVELLERVVWTACCKSAVGWQLCVAHRHVFFCHCHASPGASCCRLSSCT